MTASENIHSYVNNINTIEGGTHVSGFRRPHQNLQGLWRQRVCLKRPKWILPATTSAKGLPLWFQSRCLEPQFEGQTKTKLGNSEVLGIVDTIAGEALNNYLEENPKMARMMIIRHVLAAQARTAARKARELVQRKRCLKQHRTAENRPIAEKTLKMWDFFLVEGDSAGWYSQTGS